MPRLPAITAAQLVVVLTNIGFETTRQRGSHVRMKHPDGRAVSIPIHSSRNLGRGLLRKILRDTELNREDFLKLLDQ